MVCTFFGHRYADKKIEPALRSTLVDLIENHNVRLFYVGNHGKFDDMARKIIQELSIHYPVTYYVVISYMPTRKNDLGLIDYSDTILPENIENVPKRFAIAYCNKWMIRQSDYVVTYVTNHIGSGAAKFKELAEKCHKTVIEISI